MLHCERTEFEACECLDQVQEYFIYLSKMHYKSRTFEAITEIEKRGKPVIDGIGLFSDTPPRGLLS